MKAFELPFYAEKNNEDFHYEITVHTYSSHDKHYTTT
jgi:hypothetical protein